MYIYIIILYYIILYYIMIIYICMLLTNQNVSDSPI